MFLGLHLRNSIAYEPLILEKMAGDRKEAGMGIVSGFGLITVESWGQVYCQESALGYISQSGQQAW